MTEQAKRELDEAGFAVARELGKNYEKLERENRRLRAALEQVEWGDEDEWCPWCGNGRVPGHAPHCARQLALAPERIDAE